MCLCRRTCLCVCICVCVSMHVWKGLYTWVSECVHVLMGPCLSSESSSWFCHTWGDTSSKAIHLLLPQQPGSWEPTSLAGPQRDPGRVCWTNVALVTSEASVFWYDPLDPSSHVTAYLLRAMHQILHVFQTLPASKVCWSTYKNTTLLKEEDHGKFEQSWATSVFCWCSRVLAPSTCPHPLFPSLYLSFLLSVLLPPSSSGWRNIPAWRFADSFLAYSLATQQTTSCPLKESPL